jgi:hypothetical protein
MGRNQDDDDCRTSEIAHGQRASVEQHGHQHDGQHDERAHGSNHHAGYQQVGENRKKCGKGCIFPDRMAGGKIRECGEQSAHQSHDRTRHQRHMQAGYGDDVIDACLAHRLVYFFGNACPHTDDQRCRDFAFWPADAVPDAPGNRLPPPLDRSTDASGQRRVSLLGQLWSGEKEAARANASKIIGKGCVVAVRSNRSAWR